MQSQLLKSKILIVEDDPDIGRIAQLVLQKAHYDVELTDCARVALQSIAANRPDLIVCDVMMPEMDGLELLAMLRQDEATQEIPVLMMSALTDDSDVRKAEIAGAEYYLKKPFSPTQLTAAVKGVFATVSIRNRLHSQNGS